MDRSLLRVRAVVAGYAAPVVGPFSLEVSCGDVIGLAGPNGTGKSTLLKAFASGARIFSGEVEKKPGLTIGWQQQQPVFPLGMPFTGRDYLRCAQANFDAIPSRLARWLDKRVDALSGGQFQLLSVWAVLGGFCDLVLLDEPTNNLDPEGAAILTDALQRDLGHRAVLLVSHERDFLEGACSRVLEVGQ